MAETNTNHPADQETPGILSSASIKKETAPDHYINAEN